MRVGRSFIRAVAGQPPRGYERAVLDRGDLPTGLRQSIHEVESARRTRGKGFDRVSALDAVPVPAEGICLKRKPIFADGEFPVEHRPSLSAATSWRPRERPRGRAGLPHRRESHHAPVNRPPDRRRSHPPTKNAQLPMQSSTPCVSCTQTGRWSYTHRRTPHPVKT